MFSFLFPLSIQFRLFNLCFQSKEQHYSNIWEERHILNVNQVGGRPDKLQSCLTLIGSKRRTWLDKSHAFWSKNTHSLITVNCQCLSKDLQTYNKPTSHMYITVRDLGLIQCHMEKLSWEWVQRRWQVWYSGFPQCTVKSYIWRMRLLSCYEDPKNFIAAIIFTWHSKLLFL